MQRYSHMQPEPYATASDKKTCRLAIQSGRQRRSNDSTTFLAQLRRHGYCLYNKRTASAPPYRLRRHLSSRRSWRCRYWKGSVTGALSPHLGPPPAAVFWCDQRAYPLYVAPLCYGTNTTIVVLCGSIELILHKDSSKSMVDARGTAFVPAGVSHQIRSNSDRTIFIMLTAFSTAASLRCAQDNSFLLPPGQPHAACTAALPPLDDRAQWKDVPMFMQSGDMILSPMKFVPVSPEVSFAQTTHHGMVYAHTLEADSATDSHYHPTGVVYIPLPERGRVCAKLKRKFSVEMSHDGHEQNGHTVDIDLGEMIYLAPYMSYSEQSSDYMVAINVADVSPIVLNKCDGADDARARPHAPVNVQVDRGGEKVDTNIRYTNAFLEYACV